jgi:hypothetical protein
LGIDTRAYYEKGTVKGFKVVDEGSADPRVAGCIPIPVDANHIGICKPSDRLDPVYSGIAVFISSRFRDLVPVEPPDDHPPDPPGAEYNINTVFGMQRGNTSHYVYRSQVDELFLSSLIGDKHVCVYGSSKQGKTALRKKYISRSDELVVSCERGWSSNEIFAAILKAAVDARASNLTPASDAIVAPPTGTGGNRAPTTPTPPAGTARGRAESVPISFSDVSDFLRILQRVFTGKYIVVEEFHYLEERVQRDFAYRLKPIHELSDYIFIVIGVWLEKNRVAHLNQDLAGRVAPINADEWSDQDLSRVVHGGEEKLNITFPQGFADDLVKRACGSVYLVREACYRACVISRIFGRAETRYTIEKSLSVPGILRDISSEGVDYTGKVIQLLEPAPDIELNDQEREQDLRAWVLRALIYANAKDIIKGISVRRLRTWIREMHPRNYNPSEGQIEKIIKGVQAAQHIRAGYSLFDYDRQDKMLRCVDKGYILWRTNTQLSKIKDLVFQAEVSSGQ